MDRRRTPWLVADSRALVQHQLGASAQGDGMLRDMERLLYEKGVMLSSCATAMPTNDS
jgi:hypothetical protein